MNKGALKLKDLMTIALLTVIFVIIYMAAMTASTALGPFGHAISPGFAGFLGGAVLLFMNRKVGKMWTYTIFTALVMAIISLTGAGYLPWIISSMVTAVIADLIASRSNDTPIWKLGVASGIMFVGHTLGGILPATFFMENYRDEFVGRGMMTPEAMAESIHYTTGIFAILGIVITFVLAFAGIYVGYAILRKHLEKMKR